MKDEDRVKRLFEGLDDDPEYIAAALMIEINEVLYVRMKEIGLSQKELAKRIGKSQPYVSRILNNGTNMTLLTLAKFAAALEMEVYPPVFVSKDHRVILNTELPNIEYRLRSEGVPRRLVEPDEEGINKICSFSRGAKCNAENVDLVKVTNPGKKDKNKDEQILSIA